MEETNSTINDGIIDPEEAHCLKNMYDNCWQNRKFELENLWQRSIFLATFLVLIFTGYGILMMKFADAVGADSGNAQEQQLLFLNFCAVLLSLVGIFLSTLWITMGKGSKAWYERYQNALKALEKIDGNSHNVMHINGKKVGTFNCEDLPDFKPSAIDYKIRSTNAGAFSTSRINIAIGQIALCMWLFVFIAHIIWVGISVLGLTAYVNIPLLSGILLFVFSLLAIYFFFTRIKKTHWLKSEVLGKQIK